MSAKLKAMEVIKSLIAAYVVTGIALAILAFLVYKMELTESVVNIAIVAIYIIASFLGGFITGKKVKEKKFVWGLLLGVLYIFIIYLVSTIISQDFNLTSASSITAFFLCVGGGLLGGMVS